MATVRPLDGLDAHTLRRLQTVIGLVGGGVAGLLIGNGEYVPGAIVGVVALLVTYALPKRYDGAVTDERTDAIRQWASAVTVRLTCTGLTAGLFVGAVAVGLGYVDPPPMAIGALAGGAAVVVTYLLALGYASRRNRP